MKPIIGKKTFPCGSEKQGKLQDHLAHYRGCSHEGCTKRATAWEVIGKKLGLSTGEES